MATEPTPQRLYRAACPNCGAPVEFRSAAAPFAVCSFCRSTVVRAGDQLRKIGESAEVFDDHTPLQLGAAGKYQGANFTIVGRLQYRYGDGTWNEWHALFESGPELQKSGWLSDDNGRYVVAFDAPLQTQVPPPENLQPGAPLTVNGESWSVASVVAAKLIAAQGELPRRPNLEKGFVVADLRSARGEVGTIDYTEPARPMWSVGRSVALSELAMTGLSEAGEKTLSGRTLQCPSCGAALEVKLETTQSIVCHQCKSVVDVSQGVGGDLAQHIGDLAGVVVELLVENVLVLDALAERLRRAGDRHRPTPAVLRIDDEGEALDAVIEQVFAPEGLLVVVALGDLAALDVADHLPGQWRLAAERDRADRAERDLRLRAGGLLVVGEVPADALLAAFRLGADKRAALQRDALPTAFSAASKLVKVIFWIFIVVVVLLLFRCGDDGGKSDCNEVRNTFGDASQEYQSCLNNQRSGSGYRSGGGAFGGFSSGGGHK